ncbi:hypothetical protein E4K10_43580 [Streptomyces sp. T1317-0309]|nr:hypothetical protein E4K10_43580 [Streptomyces sp. T1317-0309]
MSTQKAGTALVTVRPQVWCRLRRGVGGAGHDLLLVARDRARLDSSAASLAERFGVEVSVLSADLATPKGIRSVEDRRRRTPRSTCW